MPGDASTWAEVPQELQERDQWLLWDASAETPRRPHWNGDFTVSWSDPNEWHSFQEATDLAEKTESWGIGYVTAIDNTDHARGLYGVIDIDGGVLDIGGLKEWVPPLDKFIDAGAYMEYSPSGNGIHIPVVGFEKPNWFSDVQLADADHEGIDYLTNKFCTFTGDTLDVSGNDVFDADPSDWLIEIYRNITGRLPRDESKVNDQSHDGQEYFTEDDVRDALNCINPDVDHPMWLRLGFAVHDFDDSTTGKQLFIDWSKRGQKWDTQAERQVDWIWNNARPGSDVTLGTLVHHAKQNGWTPPQPNRGRPAAADGGAAAQDQTNEPVLGKQPTALKPGAVISRAGYDPDEHTLADIKASEAAFAIDRILDDTDDYHLLVVNDDTEDIYSFHPADGVWKRDGERVLKEVCRKAMHSENSKRVHSETVYQLQGNPNIKIDRDGLGAPDGTVATPNGLLDLLSLDTKPLKPSHHALNRIKAAFRDGIDYEDTRWMEFLENSVHNADLKKLQEYAGYCLWHHAQPYGKALFLVGPTDSGKGTFLKAITQVLGAENVANESLYDLLQTRWGRARIYGKMANIRNEVTPGGLSNIQLFKELTGGGDTVSAEYKGQDKFEFTVTQKFLFSTNQMPEVEEADTAFLNRLLFAVFPETVPEDQQDPELLETFEQERDAILAWMLDGLQRLKRQDTFTNERSYDEKETLIQQHGDSIDRFVHSVIDVTGDPDDMVHKSELYEVYIRFCDYIGHDAEVQQQFTKAIKAEDGVDDGQSRRVGTGDDRPDVYKGIRVDQDHCRELQADVPSFVTSDGDSDEPGGQSQLG